MKPLAMLLLAAGLITALSACSGNQAPQSAPPATSPPAPSSQSSAPSSAPSSAGAETPADQAGTSPSAESSAGTGSASSSPTSAPKSSPAEQQTSGAAADCEYGALKPAIRERSGAAGSVYLTIALTNGSRSACKLQGYPGVSLVGSGNGTQIGAPARREEGKPAEAVNISPGQSATFVVRVTQADNYRPEDCRKTPADGLRIYPPGSKEALFVADKTLNGCANEKTAVLTVRPVGAQG